MEHLEFRFAGRPGLNRRAEGKLVGVVGSGNLEVLIEPVEGGGECIVTVSTSIAGFGETWRQVLSDFMERHVLSNIRISINDGGATPAVVSLRLDQSIAVYLGAPKMTKSYLEAGSRGRIANLLDVGSFVEFLGPTARVTSPHLPVLDMPIAFDDGVAVGEGTINGRLVLIAAQEGGFMGGAVGEVHGAKLTGLMQRALDIKPDAVLLLLDTGGVRLQEANAGLIAMGEIQRAVLSVRHAGIPVIALIGGRNGCYGGLSIIARSCDWIIGSEEGRLSISGPEVIETVEGAEEFDSHDRALVWRTMGLKHRRLIGEIDRVVGDDITAFRAAASDYLGRSRDINLDTLEAEHGFLARRLKRFEDCRDAREVWARIGINEPARVPDLDPEPFETLASAIQTDRRP